MAYTNLYKRSIYFAIHAVNENGEAGSLVESFAFTIPPQNIETTYTQRTTVTQTVGGNWIDRYGLGNAKIAITGETGNEEDRIAVLGAGKTPRSLNGQECWFEFKDRIVFWSQKNENFIMKYYDLTHKNSVSPFQPESRVAGRTEAWEVVLQDVNSLRGYTKPFFYPYKIQLEGVRPLGTYNPRSANNNQGLLSNVSALIESVSASVLAFNSNVELFLSNNFEYVNDIVDILSASNTFLDQITSFGDLVLEYEQKLAGLFSDVLSESEDILTSSIQVIAYPYYAVETAKDSIQSLVEQSNSLATKARNAGKDTLALYDWDEEIDSVSEIETNTNNIQVSFNDIMVVSKQSASDEPIGAVSINGDVQLFYGFNSIVVQENTRLDTLARDIYGDPDFKDAISAINGIYSNEELVVGSRLLLPALQPVTRNSNNLIYNQPDQKDDLLGRDALLRDGVFQLTSDDYAIVTGDDNLYQNMDNRLSEQRDRQIRDDSYGVVADIGEALDGDASFEFISISLKETLLADPRILDVYDLNFDITGDQVYQTFKFDTISKLEITYKEVI